MEESTDIYSRKEYEEILEEFADLTVKSKLNPFARIRIHRLIRRLLNEDSAHSHVHIGAGVLYAWLGRRQRALLHFGVAMALEPGRVTSQIALLKLSSRSLDKRCMIEILKRTSDLIEPQPLSYEEVERELPIILKMPL